MLPRSPSRWYIHTPGEKIVQQRRSLEAAQGKPKIIYFRLTAKIDKMSTPKNADAALAYLSQIVLESKDSQALVAFKELREYFAHLETEVLTAHTPFTKLLVYVLTTWSLTEGLEITSPQASRKIHQLLTQPLGEACQEYCNRLNQADVLDDLATLGISPQEYAYNRTLLEQAYLEKYPRERFKDLADRLVAANLELSAERKGRLSREMAQPTSTLTDKLLGRTQRWSLTQVKKAVADFAFYHLSKAGNPVAEVYPEQRKKLKI